MAKQIQTSKTLEEVSRHIFTTMWGEFIDEPRDKYDALSKFIHKKIDGLHYYILARCDDETADYDYCVIRTNYKFPDKNHPSKDFYGTMKYCLGDSENLRHIDEKLNFQSGKYQYYHRYENKKTKDYQMCNELTQKKYDELKNYKISHITSPTSNKNI